MMGVLMGVIMLGSYPELHEVRFLLILVIGPCVFFCITLKPSDE